MPDQGQKAGDIGRPNKSTGFVCAQLLNTVRCLAEELKDCDCPRDPETCKIIEHETHCAHWQAAFLIHRFEHDHMPEDAEIWMRVVTIVSALQENRRRGTAIGYTAVPEGPMNELARIAEGFPRAVTDAYAAMESLRGVVARMQERRKAPITDKTKTGKARAAGERKAIDAIIDDIEQITNPMATDICSGLIQIFAAWTTTRPVPIVVGSTEDSTPMLELAEQFIVQHKLRRNPEKEA